MKLESESPPQNSIIYNNKRILERILTKHTNKDIRLPSGESLRSLEKMPKPKPLPKNVTPSIGKVMLQKLLRQGEVLLNKLPIKKIIPLMKKNKNNNFLWIIFFVKKFVKNLKLMTFEKRFKTLSSNHFKLINDNSRLNESHFFSFEGTIQNENCLIKKVNYFINILFTF